MSHRLLSNRWRLNAVGIVCASALFACNSNDPKSLVAAGKEASAKSDHKTAVIQFKSALQNDPNSVETRLLLGTALLEAGDAQGAIVELNKVLDAKGSAEKVLPPLARALLLVGDFKKITSAYGNTTLDDKAALASLKTSVSKAWMAQSEQAKAAESLDAALKSDPNFGPALLLRVRQLVAKQDVEAAAALIDKTMEQNPTLKEGWVLKGDVIAIGKQDFKASEAAYRQALALDKAFLPAQSALIVSRLRDRDIPGAKAQLDQLKAVLPNNPMTTMIEAQLAFQNGELVKARELSQQLMRLAPGNVGVLQLAGAIEAQNHALIPAETHYTKALQINPELVQVRHGLARVYIELGQPAKSMETLKPLLAGASPSADTLTLAGEAELARGDVGAAEGYFNRAAKLTPDNQRLKTALAMTQLAKGDTTTAFAELGSLAAKDKDTAVDEAIVISRIKRREFGAALAAIDVMAKKQPDNPKAFDLRGRVYMERKDFAAARAAYEQELKLDPSLLKAVLSLASIDVIERKPEAAIQRLEAHLKVDPRNSYALVALAELKSNNGAPLAEVKKMLADAIALSPQAPEPRLRLIALTLRKRLYKEALVAAQEAAAALPGDPAIMDAVGKAQMEAGDVEQAIGTFRRLAGAESKSGVAYMRLADIYMTIGKRELVEGMLKKALEVEPNLVSAQAGLVDFYVTTNRKSEALELCKRLQREHPDRDSGYLIEANYQLRMKAVDAAIAAYRNGLTKTDSPQIARELHKLLEESGRREEAARFGASWLKAHPEDASFEYQLSMVDIYGKQYAQAEARLLRLVEKRPKNAAALNNLAVVQLRMGKPSALAYAQRAADAAPTNPGVLDTLASALAADKQLDKALATQKRAVELAPQANNLRLDLARIAIQAGDKALAKVELDRLKGLGDKFKEQGEVEQLQKSL